MTISTSGERGDIHGGAYDENTENKPVEFAKFDEKHMEGVLASHGGGIEILIVYKHFY